MSRYCELKLIDFLKAEKPEMPKSRRKSTVLKTFSLESQNTKSRLGNISLLKRKNDSSCDTTNHLVESRETRQAKKSNSTVQDVAIDSGKGADSSISLRKVGETKREIPSGSSKRYNIEEPSKKKIVCTGSSFTVSSIAQDKSSAQSRKRRKRKPRESVWENKLTGAKRVSKRLSNLRMQKQKRLKTLGSPKNETQARNESRQSATKELCEKQPKNKKTSYYRNRSEVQFNFGKLSHTKRLYPKIVTARRPPTFTVTIKTAGSTQQDSRKRVQPNNKGIHSRFDDDSQDSYDDNSIINEHMEDVEGEMFDEDVSIELSDTDITKDIEMDKSDLQPAVNETAEDSIAEAKAQECGFKTVECGTGEKELLTDSTIIIAANNESDCIFEGGKLEENAENKQSSVPTSNQEEIKVTRTCDAKPSEAVSEDATTDSEESKKEEKGKANEENIGHVSEDETKSEITNKEPTSATVDSNVVSPETDIIDITVTIDED